MTATPIPRSLALTIYGDLDLSVIDEMPPGRQSVNTYVITPQERERAYNLIRKEVDQGGQAFIIYPLIEESETSEVLSAVEELSRLQKEIFPNYRLGLLHGRLKQEEKDKTMESFQAGEYQILVSTSVVEVGVDIPKATVMLIEGANHFGLAQLHQFRGRVGRSTAKSYCLLVPDNTEGLENERLQVMATTDDGFILAERDLEQRGPGEFLGTRQAGFSELKFVKLTDVHLIEKARHHAQVVYDEDPGLNLPEHRALDTELARFWGKPKGDIS
jgi:ATP-dependent DNA helicase RecG